jgi:hypothetical protein
MSQDAPWFAAIDTLASWGRESAAAVRADDGAVLQIDQGTARVLSCCQGARTLEEHASRAWSQGAAVEPGAIVRAFDSLCELGLLRRLEPAPVRRAICSDPLDTVVILTADRPSSVKRCVASIRENTSSHGRAPKVLLIDGSHLEQSRATNSQMVADSADQGRMSYWGQERVSALKQVLVQKGVPVPVVTSGLNTAGIGGNRNVALLATAGSRFLTIDDDVVAVPWRLQGSTGNVRLVGHSEPREWRFFLSRDEAVQTGCRCSIDLLALHESVLGIEVSAILGSAASADYSDACPHVLSKIQRGDSWRSRVTVSGLAGDTGRYCPHQLMFLSGSVGQRLRTDADMFRTALESREVQRISSEFVFSHEPTTPTYCTGVDNVSVTPPFIPHGRGEDMAFGVTLALIDPTAAFAHLPYGIIHDSDRQPSHVSEHFKSANEVRVAEIVMVITKACAPRCQEEAPSDRLRGLAKCVADFAALPDTTFAASIRNLILVNRSQTLELADVTSSGEHQLWRPALNEYKRMLIHNMASNDFFVPSDCEPGGNKGMAALKTFLCNYAELLRWWPTMWEICSDTGAQPVGQLRRHS